MTGNDNLHHGLAPVPTSNEELARELRQMAAASGKYKRFTYLSPWVKNVWNAAADVIEEDATGRSKEDHAGT
jgi:hypothetical protein